VEDGARVNVKVLLAEAFEIIRSLIVQAAEGNPIEYPEGVPLTFLDPSGGQDELDRVKRVTAKIRTVDLSSLVVPKFR
jgi:hypothetical protein